MCKTLSLAACPDDNNESQQSARPFDANAVVSCIAVRDVVARADRHPLLCIQLLEDMAP